MSKFVFIYHGPAEMPEGAAPSEDDMKAVMGEWGKWAEKVGGDMTDFGTPLGGGQMVTPGGKVAASGSDITGYTILEAADMDAAVALAKVHPHLNMPGGCEVEVLEGADVPGM